MIETNISTNENLVQVFCGVRGYEKDGVAYLHIEDVARGLGFTYEATSSGNTVVRWNRVDEYLQGFGFVATSGDGTNPHDYYIPENIFYRLCMKAKNEVAKKLHPILALTVRNRKSLRRCGQLHATGASSTNFQSTPSSQRGQSQNYSPTSASRSQTESSGAGTPPAHSYFPNGRATFWTKCIRTTCFY